MLDALERRILGVGKDLTGKRLGAFDDPRSLLFGKSAKPTLTFNGAPGKAAGGAAGDKISDQQRELASYVRALDGQVQKLDELSEKQKALNFLQGLGTTGQIPQVRELVLGLAQQADALRDIKAQEEDIAALRKLEVSATRDLDEEIDRLAGRSEERRKIALTNRLEKILASGIEYSPEELNKIVNGIAGINTELTQTKGIADELGSAFASAFEEAIIGGRNLGDVLRALEHDILRLITRELVTDPLSKAITGMIKGSGGGGLGDIFSKIGSWLFGGGKASGGGVDAGGLYQVNERGHPEMLKIDGKEFLMMGSRRGWVDPNPRSTSNRSTTINAPITINMPGGATAATANQVGAAVARKLQLAAARNA